MWKGPSRVTAVNGKKLFIDRGARLGTVNRDDAVRVGEEFWRMDDQHSGAKKPVREKKSKVGHTMKLRTASTGCSPERLVIPPNSVQDVECSS